MPKKTTVNRNEQPKRRAFLAAYGQVGNITSACKLAKCSRTIVYTSWMLDKNFMEEFEKAKDEAADLLEDEARRRALGFDETVYHDGKVIGTVKKYSDVLLIFLLKGARPKIYREHISQEVTGKDGAPLAVVPPKIDLSTLDRDTLIKLANLNVGQPA